MNRWDGLVRTGAGEEPPVTLLDQVKKGIGAITPALILTGIAIGFASAIGNALGGIFVERYVRSRQGRKRR